MSPVKREAKFALKFRHWLRANPPRFSATFELKDASTKQSFPFADWKQAQQDWAEAITYGTKGVLMRQIGGNGEPDYTFHYHQPAFVVINFKDGFEVISANILRTEIERSKRKSLTHTRARQISTYSIVY